MLPPLPTPDPAARSAPPWVACLRRAVAGLSLLLALALPLGLAGCAAGGQPPQRVLLDALALQIQLTQDQVAAALDLPSEGLPTVSRVRVEEQEALRIGTAKGLRLTGRFDWRLSGDPIRVDSPFTLFLQQGERGESWRLAQPSGGGEAGQDWFTYPLPLSG
jgi:hypothetical protein